jgi:hypothetical protein
MAVSRYILFQDTVRALDLSDGGMPRDSAKSIAGIQAESEATFNTMNIHEYESSGKRVL